MERVPAGILNYSESMHGGSACLKRLLCFLSFISVPFGVHAFYMLHLISSIQNSKSTFLRGEIARALHFWLGHRARWQRRLRAAAPSRRILFLAQFHLADVWRVIAYEGPARSISVLRTLRELLSSSARTFLRSVVKTPPLGLHPSK